MKLEEMVSNKELSKKLKDLGVPQNSLWCWVQYIYTKPAHEKHPLYTTEVIPKHDAMFIDMVQFEISAFTVAELGELLPQYLKSRGFMLTTVKNEKNHWWVGYTDHLGKAHCSEREKTEADARAAMLVYLLENGLVKA